MSDRFVGFGEPRAFACVIRDGVGGRELLVFDHPIAGTQLPKGRIDPGESSEVAAVRELAEESGLELEPTGFIGHVRTQFEHPADGYTVEEDWYVWRSTPGQASPSPGFTWPMKRGSTSPTGGYSWTAKPLRRSTPISPR